MIPMVPAPGDTNGVSVTALPEGRVRVRLTALISKSVLARNVPRVR